jgi:hypothetical protein
MKTCARMGLLLLALTALAFSGCAAHHHFGVQGKHHHFGVRGGVDIPPYGHKAHK